MKVRTLFIGTGSFAIPIFKSLLESDNVEIVGIVTQPDKPAGRDQKLTPAPLKQALVEEFADGSFQVFQPEKLRLDAQTILDQTKPELIIVAAYGQIIPDSMLEYPKYKCLNLHGSLLPHLRGAVPVPMAILEGLTESGVTIQRMVKELDAGPIIAIRKIVLADDETAESLMQKLAESAASLLMETLPDWCQGKLAEVPQDESQATFCYQDDIAKEKAEVKFDTPVIQAERMVRAFYPWPVAWINQKSKIIDQKRETRRVKIFKARIADDIQLTASSLQLTAKDGRLFLCLADGCLELLELQLEGKQRRSAKDYLYLTD